MSSRRGAVAPFAWASRRADIWRAAWPYLIPAAIVLAAWPFLIPASPGSDQFIFWGAGHLVVTGRSPYDRAAWEALAGLGPPSTLSWILREMEVFWTYPPQTALLFAPFGALPVGIGLPLVQLFVLAGAAAGAVAAARALGLSGARLSFALTVAFLAEPVAIGIRVGQPVGLVLLGATLAFVGAGTRRSALLTLGAVLLSLKPHVVTVLISGLAVYLARKDPRGLAVAAGAVCAVTLAANAVSPYPLAAVANALRERPSQDVATTLALARDLGGGPALAAALAALAFVAALVAWRSAPTLDRAHAAFAGALALSLVVAPYAHDHDQTLLVPALFLFVRLGRGSPHELLSSAVAGAVAAVVPWAYLVTRLATRTDLSYVEGPLGALPIAAVLALAVASRSASQRAERHARDRSCDP